MKIKNTKKLDFGRLITYVPDDFSILMFFHSAPITNIVSIDAETLGVATLFPVEAEMSEYYKPCIDDSCIYFPTKMGQILALDKFSGKILSTANLSMPIMSDLEQDEESVYNICAVPVSRKWKLVTHNYCACISDKKTGEKTLQTSYFSGNPGFVHVSDEHIWVTAGSRMFKYDKVGDIKRLCDLGTPAEYAPVFSDNRILVGSSTGAVRILDEDLSTVRLIRSVPNISNLEPVDEGIAAVMTEKGACRIDYKEGTFKEILANRQLSSGSILHHNSKTFGCDNSGGLVGFDFETGLIKVVKLGKTPLFQPVVVEDKVYVSSMDSIHEIEVTDDL